MVLATKNEPGTIGPAHRQLTWLDGRTLCNIDDTSSLVYLKHLMQKPCVFCILAFAGGLIDLMAASDVKV